MAATGTNTSQTSGVSGIERAREIASSIPVTAVQQAQGIASGVPPYTVPQQQTDSRSVPGNGLPFYPQAGSDNWGLALAQNNQIRNQTPAGQEPPLIFRMTMVESRPESRPYSNPAYVASIPVEIKNYREAGEDAPLPVTSDVIPAPITESKATSEIDRIIEDSKDVVDEIISTVDPKRPPVEPTQDIVVPPAPITPTELVLEAQANCEQKTKAQDINIEIINQIDVQSTSNFSASLSSAAFATSSAEGIADFFIKGCMDPDALNYDATANIPDPGSCEYRPADAIKGCTNVEALNFNPDATEDDGSCEFEPILPPIPPMSQFLDSHGQLIFEIPSALVEQEGVVKMPKGSTVQLTATRDLVNPKAENPIVRPNLGVESDLLLTLEEESVAARKNIRKSFIGKKLASDVVEEGSKDVIIRNKPIDTKVNRTTNGSIVISTNTPILKTSLQSQAFIYEDYRKNIDSSFSELVGKM